MHKTLLFRCMLLLSNKYELMVKQWLNHYPKQKLANLTNYSL